MVIISKTILLTNEEIDSTVEELTAQYTKEAGKKALPAAKIRIPIEELILNCRAIAGDSGECTVELKKEFGSLKFELLRYGPKFNHEDIGSEFGEYSDFSKHIIENLNLKPKYSFSSANGGTNKVTLTLEKKSSSNKFLYMIFAALAIAAGIYFILTNFFDSSVANVAYEVSLPLFSKLTAIISAVATPLVFFAVLTGIIGIGDTHSFGRIGKTLIKEMMLTYLLAGLLFGVIGGIIYYTGGSTLAEGSGLVSQITTLVLDIFPSNLVEPFLMENDLQVITLAIFAGFVLLLVSKKVPSVKKLCFELSAFFNKMMLVVCKLLPLVVFIGVFNLLVSGSLGQITKIYKMIIVFIISCAGIIVALTVRARIKAKVPMKNLLKKMTPALLITLTTSSQVSAIPENMTCFKKGFGIESDFVDFSFPLCVVTYMPCGAAFLGLTMFSLAPMCGVPISVFTIVKVCVIAIIVAIAAPPIPGSAFAVFPIIFAAGGLSYDVYPIAVIIGTVIGYFLPFLNCYCLQLKTLITAIKLNEIDRTALAKEI